MTPPSSDLAPIIVALATFVTAVASAVGVLANVFRRRIEAKLDAAVTASTSNGVKLDSAATVRNEIHDLVNGGLKAAKERIVQLEAETEQLRATVRRLSGPQTISDH